jgi:hypothetical protein
LLRLLTRGLAVIGGVVVILTQTPLSNWVARPLVIYAPLEKADAIVVLGGGVRYDGALNDITQQRLIYALRLLREGYAPVMILTGGNPDDPDLSESEQMERVARELGFPPESFFDRFPFFEGPQKIDPGIVSFPDTEGIQIRAFDLDRPMGIGSRWVGLGGRDLFLRLPVELDTPVVEGGVGTSHDGENPLAVGFLDQLVGLEEGLVLSCFAAIGDDVGLDLF